MFHLHKIYYSQYIEHVELQEHFPACTHHIIDSYHGSWLLDTYLSKIVYVRVLYKRSVYK